MPSRVSPSLYRVRFFYPAKPTTTDQLYFTQINNMFFLFGLLWKNNLIIVHLTAASERFFRMLYATNFVKIASRIWNPLLLKARLLSFPAFFSTSTIPRTAIPSFLFDLTGQKSKGSITPSIRKAIKLFQCIRASLILCSSPLQDIISKESLYFPNVHGTICLRPCPMGQGFTF